MKKLILAVLMVLVTVPAYADIFPNGTEDKLKVSYGDAKSMSLGYPEPGTILDAGTGILGYLGTLEGGYYDVVKGEFTNYLGATIYTIPNSGFSFNFGMPNMDGVVAGASFNVGAVIPTEDVPLLSFTQYLHVGYVGGKRYLDDESGLDKKDWKWSHGPIAMFKITY